MDVEGRIAPLNLVMLCFADWIKCFVNVLFYTMGIGLK